MLLTSMKISCEIIVIGFFQSMRMAVFKYFNCLGACTELVRILSVLIRLPKVRNDCVANWADILSLSDQ